MGGSEERSWGRENEERKGGQEVEKKWKGREKEISRGREEGRKRR